MCDIFIKLPDEKPCETESYNILEIREVMILSAFKGIERLRMSLISQLDLFSHTIIP
jgi:hypothetical protein